VILSFRDEETVKIFNNEVSRKLPADIQTTALRKLLQLNAAVSLGSLRVPPGNRLEALKRDRSGQHSIRINDQWRISLSGRCLIKIMTCPPGRAMWKSQITIKALLVERLPNCCYASLTRCPNEWLKTTR